MEDKPLVPIKRLRPTNKQTKTLQILKEEPGISTRKAMIKAGYSVKTANLGGEFWKHKRVQNYLNGLKEYIGNAGLTNQAATEKLKELWNFEKVVSVTKDGEKILHPDGELQLKVLREWKEIMGSGESEDGKVKRRMTIEEYVNDELKDDNEKD